MLHDARPFAKHGDRADAGAAGSEDVRFEDRQRRAAEIARGDLLDEARNVDVGRAGRSAWRVEAVEAAVGFDDRRLRGEWRMEVRETLGEFGIRMKCLVHPSSPR